MQIKDGSGTKQLLCEGGQEIGSLTNGTLQEFRLVHPEARYDLTFAIELKDKVILSHSRFSRQYLWFAKERGQSCRMGSLFGDLLPEILSRISMDKISGSRSQSISPVASKSNENLGTFSKFFAIVMIYLSISQVESIICQVHGLQSIKIKEVGLGDYVIFGIPQTFCHQIPSDFSEEN